MEKRWMDEPSWAWFFAKETAPEKSADIVGGQWHSTGNSLRATAN
jgi:hypothetical protein